MKEASTINESDMKTVTFNLGMFYFLLEIVAKKLLVTFSKSVKYTIYTVLYTIFNYIIMSSECLLYYYITKFIIQLFLKKSINDIPRHCYNKICA